MELFSIPLHTSWTVEQNCDMEGLELRYSWRERKKRYSYQDYDLLICVRREGEGWLLSFAVQLKVGASRVLETRRLNGREKLPWQLSLFQCKTRPEHWGAENIAWVNGLWREAQRRLSAGHIKLAEPPRVPTHVQLIRLKVPAGWTAAWNTLDESYLSWECSAPEEDADRLHWERDIAMFTRGEVCLDVEDWSNEDMKLTAFRVHLYRWTEDGPVTLGEETSRDLRQVLEKTEEFLGREF